jgi:hypothetical protein
LVYLQVFNRIRIDKVVGGVFVRFRAALHPDRTNYELFHPNFQL